MCKMLLEEKTKISQSLKKLGAGIYCETNISAICFEIRDGGNCFMIFHPLNCDEMVALGRYIKKIFFKEDTYRHNLPKFQTFEGNICLCVHKNTLQDARF